MKNHIQGGWLIYSHINPFQGFISVCWAGPLAGARGYSYFATLWRSKIKTKKYFMLIFTNRCDKHIQKVDWVKNPNLNTTESRQGRDNRR